MNLAEASFTLNGITLPYFWHAHNCGTPDDPKTERVVEVAIADYWLSRVENVTEIGAVTPYYFPGRVPAVIDPCDPHPFVTDSVSMLNFDFTGRNVLCISTLEHIGTGQYLDEQANALDALAKLIAESDKMLVTFGAGQHMGLDWLAYLFGIETCSVYFLTRHKDQTWTQAERRDAFRRYGPWANSVAILEKGGVLGG
jgi:hypothetical protein